MKLLKDEWLFISTRKCATNSIYEALPGSRVGGFHAIPDRRLAPVHWTVVRNPYFRALSIWGSTCNRPGDKYGAKAILGKDKSFKNFARTILGTEKKPIYQNMCYYHDTFLLDDFARIECLEQDIERITGLKIVIPYLNTSSHHYVMDREDIENVNKWAGDDFIRYGYDKR